MTKWIIACVMALVFLVSIVANASTAFPDYKLTTVATGLDQPWSMAFLPDQAMLVTERNGQLRLIKNDLISEPVKGVPEIYFRGQGGLLDVKLHPDYARNGWIYLSYAHGDGKANALRLMNEGQIKR